MFEEAPLGIALIDSLTGHIIEVNSRYAEISGRSRKEMSSIDWMSITHPDDLQEDLDNMALLNAGKIPGFKMNKRYIKPDGSIVWISLTIAPVKSENKTQPRHLAMIEDISQRRRTEETLQKKSRELEQRVKVLNCLYGFSNLSEEPDISLDQILKGTINLIPPSWQYPDITAVKIKYDGKQFRSKNYKKTKWSQSADIEIKGKITGEIIINYLEEKPEIDEGPFSKEERLLINAIAGRIAREIERDQMKDVLQQYERIVHYL